LSELRWKDQVTDALSSEGLDTTPAGQYALYLELVERWNRRHNLTGFRGIQALIDGGLMASLAALPLLPDVPVGLDVGSGAGFPALPLAIAQPQRRWLLLEPRRKRSSFLMEAVHQLGLSQVMVQQARVEELDPQRRYPLITSRAITRIEKDVARLLTPDGAWILALPCAATAPCGYALDEATPPPSDPTGARWVRLVKSAKS